MGRYPASLGSSDNSTLSPPFKGVIRRQMSNSAVSKKKEITEQLSLKQAGKRPCLGQNKCQNTAGSPHRATSLHDSTPRFSTFSYRKHSEV